MKDQLYLEAKQRFNKTKLDPSKEIKNAYSFS